MRKRPPILATILATTLVATLEGVRDHDVGRRLVLQKVKNLKTVRSKTIRQTNSIERFHNAFLAVYLRMTHQGVQTIWLDRSMKLF